MRYVICVTTFRNPIRFLATGTTRAEAHAEGVAFIHRWPLDAKNQPCGLRIEESSSLFPDLFSSTPRKERPRDAR